MFLKSIMIYFEETYQQIPVCRAVSLIRLTAFIYNERTPARCPKLCAVSKLFG